MFASKHPPHSTSRLKSLLAIALAVFSMALTARLTAQEDEKNKSLDVRSSVGDLHVGNDASPRETGLPVYPGARLHEKDDRDGSNANLALFTSAFGFKLVVLNYDSEDPTQKVISYYRDKLKKYGKVLECHTHEHGGDVNVDADDHEPGKSQELKCEGDNTGNVTELKAGTQGNQHVVAIEQAKEGAGSTFALVYARARGKQGDI